MGILQEFKPGGHETLSKLSKKDLEDFKMLLNKYKMSYRDKLNIPDEASFGCEIECEGISLEKMEKYLDTYIEKFSYDIDTDGSLGKLGLEVKSPILHNTFEDFEIFRAVLTLLQRKTYITTDCGGHIHIGAHILGDKKKSMINFLKLWEAYEPVIYRFGYGEYLNERLAATFTCNGYANPFYGNIREMIDSVKNTPLRRYRAELARRLYGSSPYSDAISFQTIKSFNKEIEYNTIQFRSPNASLNPVIWQNNINFFVHLLTYSKSLEYDTRVINKKDRNWLSRTYKFF